MAALCGSQGGQEMQLLSEEYSAILSVNNGDSKEQRNSKIQREWEKRALLLQGLAALRHLLPSCSSAGICGAKEKVYLSEGLGECSCLLNSSDLFFIFILIFSFNLILYLRPWTEAQDC